MYDVIIAGAGYAGAVSARVLAEKGKKVLILEEREHIGGNAYDEVDEHGVMIHTYGPHLFHTSDKKAYDFLSRFTNFIPYHHTVMGNIHGKFMPIPFNLNSLYVAFDKEKAEKLEKKLLKAYGAETRVPILELKKAKDPEIRELAEYVFENVFVHYTMKQWGYKPEEIDPAVTARVPVITTHKDGYFTDTYQAMPDEGFTKLFEKMLDHENIKICLNTNAFDRIKLKDGKIFFDGEEFNGKYIFTGMTDVLFERKFGPLPYRSLRFDFEYHDVSSYQEAPVVNYTVSEDYTRISEFKKFTCQKDVAGTTIVKEYPRAYEPDSDMIPYYAILNDDNKALFAKYKALADKYAGLVLLGRLAEYRYFNMDAITSHALEMAEKI